MKTLKLINLLFLVLLSSISFSQGVGIINGVDGEYMKVTNSDVEVIVNNQIATVKVTQVFKNTSDSTTVFKYGFPLHDNANPISLRWFYNGVWNEAIMSGAAQNNSIPNGDEVVEPGTGGIDPFLNAYLGESPLFFSPLDTIPVDSSYAIELTYVELLTYEMGNVSFSLKNDMSGIQDDPIENQSFTYLLSSNKSILDIHANGLITTDVINTYDASLSYNGSDQAASFNYNVEYELFSDALGIIPLSIKMPDSLYDCDTMGNGYATIIIEPRPYISSDVVPKNFTLVIDESGSMMGNKIQEAKDAAIFMLENLNAGDYFNIVSFDTDVESAFNSHVVYNSANESTAINFINAISATGGTNISNALSESIAQFVGVSSEMANIVLFLTDGVGGGTNQQVLELVKSQIEVTGVEVTINTIGVGYGVNENLLEILAQDNGGLSLFIEEEAIEEEIISFFNMINNPVLLNTEITFTPNELYAVHPVNLPNLYQGQQMVVSARYDSSQFITMELTGDAFGQELSYVFNFQLSDSMDENFLILPKIWAKQKIGDLEVAFYSQSNTSVSDEIQDEIDSLSLCYQVLDVNFGSFIDDGNIAVDIEENGDYSNIFNMITYPQPFNDHVNIKFNSLALKGGLIHVEILDLSGKVVYDDVVKLSNDEFSIFGLEDLKKGSYVLKLTNENSVYSTKLLKM